MRIPILKVWARFGHYLLLTICLEKFVPYIGLMVEISLFKCWKVCVVIYCSVLEPQVYSGVLVISILLRKK